MSSLKRLTLKIRDHIAVTAFNSFTLNLKYDSVASGFSFSFYFNPFDPNHRKAFNPTHFHTADVYLDSSLLLSGTLLVPTYNSSAQKALSSFAGYSRSGVLEDCNIPTSLYPLQNDGKTLLEIAETLCSPFGLKVFVDNQVSKKVNEKYDISTADENSSIKDYLSSLASQKNVILSHTKSGDLIFTQANTNKKSLYHFTGGSQEGVLDVSLSFNGQSMHSSITTQKQASVDNDNAGEGVIENPFVAYVFRPLVKIQTSGDDLDSEDSARNILSAELKNITLKITIDSWFLNGRLVEPNNVVTVKSPENFLYHNTKWFIESVDLTQNETQNTAVLTCVLPEVYNGEGPKNIFKLH